MRYASILFVLLSFNPSSVRADVTTGLVAWYPFNLDMLDASGNGNHGSPVGGVVPTTDRFGTPDGAYEFNGTNSYIFVANSTSLSSPDTAVTQAAWVMPYGPSLVGQAFGPVIMKSASAPNAFMYRLIATPDGTFGSSYNDWFNFYGAEYPAADEWHHVASVFDGDHVRLYLDGVRVDSLAAPLTIAPGPQDLTIGGDIPGILEIFNGKIDDVRIYSRALTDDDVAELCSCGSTAVGDTPPLRNFAIRRTYPNPSAGESRVDFVLGSDAVVSLAVYDVAGRLVRSLRAGPMPEGDHAAVWDGRNDAGTAVPSGVYFVRLSVDGDAVAARTIRVR